MEAKSPSNVLTLIHTIPKGIEIVAVSKTFPFPVMQKAYAYGFRHFGENRIKEAKEKIEEARRIGLKDIVWHMVGHVQSKKVRDVVQFFDRVDSVDSIELLYKIDKEAQKQQKIIHVLLEVNISGESGKYGFRNINSFTHQLIHSSHIVIDGLMTMAPYVENPEANRSVFQSMKLLSETIRAQIPSFGSVLSMGTSCDYMVAIEEGATEVRLGEALFGKRSV